MRKIDASYRIMKIFTLLHHKPRSMEDLCSELCDEGIYINKETVTKYFKTLRKFGCIIEKIDNEFRLQSVPFSLDLSDEDFYHLAIFENLTTSLYGEDVCKYLRSVLKKVLSLVDCKSTSAYNKHLSQVEKINSISDLHTDKIAKLVKMGYENSKIKIMYNSKKINISHISFKYYDNAVFVHVFNEDTKNYELLLLNDIKEIEYTPEYSVATNVASIVVFELSGRLKKSYSLHEGERVIKADEDKIVVSNKFEDKTQLLKRLLRYGTLCRVVSPKDEVENFKSMLDNMLKNLSCVN